MATALLIARLLLGGAIFAHGAQKLFGWFGGYGIKGMGGFMESLGFRPGALFATAAALGEVGGGLLTVLGLGGPIGPALIITVMIVAILTVHLPKGFWATNGGYELNLMNIAGSLFVSFAGFGAYSLDGVFGIAGVWDDVSRWVVVGIGVLLALANMAVRRTAHRTQPTA